MTIHEKLDYLMETTNRGNILNGNGTDQSVTILKDIEKAVLIYHGYGQSGYYGEWKFNINSKDGTSKSLTPIKLNGSDRILYGYAFAYYAIETSLKEGDIITLNASPDFLVIY